MVLAPQILALYLHKSFTLNRLLWRRHLHYITQTRDVKTNIIYAICIQTMFQNKNNTLAPMTERC